MLSLHFITPHLRKVIALSDLAVPLHHCLSAMISSIYIDLYTVYEHEQLKSSKGKPPPSLPPKCCGNRLLYMARYMGRLAILF